MLITGVAESLSHPYLLLEATCSCLRGMIRRATAVFSVCQRVPDAKNAGKMSQRPSTFHTAVRRADFGTCITAVFLLSLLTEAMDEKGSLFYHGSEIYPRRDIKVQVVSFAVASRKRLCSKELSRRSQNRRGKCQPCAKINKIEGEQMDISVIDSEKVNYNDGIVIGTEEAPKKIVEFINLCCPYCRKWFLENEALLEMATENKKVTRIIKLLDKEKESLRPGNVMHCFVPRTDSCAALKAIKLIFATQEKWQELPLSEVAVFAEQNLQLTRQETAEKSARIIAEAAAANIKFVPTVIVGEAIFDESIEAVRLQKLLGL